MHCRSSGAPVAIVAARLNRGRPALLPRAAPGSSTGAGDFGRPARKNSGNASSVIRHLPFQMSAYQCQREQKRLLRLWAETGLPLGSLRVSGKDAVAATGSAK